MRQHIVHKPSFQLDNKSSPRSPAISAYSSKKSVPNLQYFENAFTEQAVDNSDLLIISPIPLNKMHKGSPRGHPTICRPKVESGRPVVSRLQKKTKDSERSPRRDPRDTTICRKYTDEIQEIEDLVNKLISKHPENEDYYRKHFSAFLRILNEAANKNPGKAPVIIKNTKMFFEGLLNGLIGRRGKIDKPNFDFEQKLRTIITKPSPDTSNSSPNNSSTINSNKNGTLKEYEDDNENVFQDLFEENKNDDNDALKKFQTEIEEIKNLIQKLINKHPENEDYYQKHYDTFIRLLNEAVNTNPGKAPIIIRNTKAFFEGLLNGMIGTNGRLKTTNFNFEQKLREILNGTNNDPNTNIIQDLINYNNLSKLREYEPQIQEIQDLMQQLINKHPENEGYYISLYDKFLKVLNDAIKTNSGKELEIIKNTKALFEGLLSDTIGTNGKIDNFDFEQRLRDILSNPNNDPNENVFQDLINDNGLKQYEPEIQEIQNLVQQLVEKHPENEDYYRNLFDDFMRVLNDAVKTNNGEKAPAIIKNAKNLFEGLLNDQIGTNGKIENDDFNFEQRLRDILSNPNNDPNENVFQDLINDNGLKQYEPEIQEIQNLVQQLVEKHPENEDYYRNLFDDFMRVLNDAVKTNNGEKAPAIIKNAKNLFEGLLNDQIGTNGKIENDDFNFEQRLRDILSNPNNDPNENVFQDLINDNGLKQYEPEIQEIQNLVQQLVEKHPENEDYYRNLFDDFMRVLNDAVKTNNGEKAPAIIKNAKNLFEGLLNDQIGTNGKIENDDFNFEQRLRDILSNDDSNADENVFQDLINDNGLKQYEPEIQEIQNLVQQLVEKHPENEDYYRNLFDDFMRVLNDAVKTNNGEKAPAIIKNAKNLFEGLLNDQIGTNGKIENDDFNFEQRLRDILSDENNNADENVFQDLIDDNILKQYEPEIQEIQNLMQQLINKHPENEDYYRNLYDDFIKVLKDAVKENNPRAPEIVKKTKSLFEGLLNDQIGSNGKLEDPNFDFEQRLRDVLSGTKDNLIDANFGMTSRSRYNLPALAEDSDYNGDGQGGTNSENANLKQYEPEIQEIQNIVHNLISKHPENEDYYTKLYDSFMKVLREAVDSNNPAAPEIIKVAKSIFEELQDGENDKLDYDFEERLRKILSGENNDDNNRQEGDSTESGIAEIQKLLQKMIEKHPENEDFYRKLYDAFNGVIQEAIAANSPSVPGLIHATKLFFEELLNDDHANLDFDIGEKLREIFSSVNGNQQENQSENAENKDENAADDDQSKLKEYESEIGEIKNMMQDLIEKHPENEDYYRKLYDAFMKIIREAVEANNPAAADIIRATKSIFEDLQDGGQPDIDIEDKLRKILNAANEDENKDSTESGIGEIQNLLKKLIEKHPENEDFYRKLYDAFNGVIQEAIAANSPSVPGLIHATKLFFEELLNGDHDTLDFDIGEKLRQILFAANENDDSDQNNKTENENAADDDQSKLKEYESEIGEIQNMMQDLIEKHPENEDYYRKLYDAFMKVIREAVENNDPAAKEIIHAAKSIFEDLQDGGQLDYDPEERLRSLLSNNENTEEGSGGGHPDLKEYESEIGEIQNMMQDLIEKHPENEDYYRKLYDAFMKVIREAVEANSPAAADIIRATKSIFEDLQDGGQLDYDIEERLRSLYNPYSDVADDTENDLSDSAILRETEQMMSQKPGAKFEKLYPPSKTTPAAKKYRTVPNYQTIINALKFTCIPGPRFTKLVDNLIGMMKENSNERFVLLMASRTLKFKGLYMMSSDGLSAKKLWGEGPNEVTNDDCSGFYKYINGQKQFDQLPILGFTPTTDGFALKRKLESDTW